MKLAPLAFYLVRLQYGYRRYADNRLRPDNEGIIWRCMMPFSGGFLGQAMVLAIVSAFFPTAAQPQSVQTLGTFLWDTVKAYGEPVQANVLIQRVSSDRLVLQVAIPTEATYRSGDALAQYKSRRIPTESMEAWILLDDGTVLEQTPRERPKGEPPLGVSNAGAVTSFVSFGFKSPANITPVGVVVKVEAHLYVFPWRGGGSSSGRARQAGQKR